MKPLAVDVPTARRFVLGMQGLWPGRRWRGAGGLTEAVRQIGSVQVDPLDVIGHSHDLAALSRVTGYRPEHMDRALYRDRSLFEWGGNLQIRPIETLPHLRPKIRTADYLGRRALFERTHPALVARVLHEVESRGPIGSRDLSEGARVSSYRARHDAGLALYYLWLRGDLMIHSRDGGDRRYDLTERLVPSRLLAPVSPAEAERHRFRRAMLLYGLPNPSEMLAVLSMTSEAPVRVRDRKPWVDRLERSGRLVPVTVTGWQGKSWVDAEDAVRLETVRDGAVPREWGPISTSAATEVTFLAPLDIVSARGRAKRLFDFDYVWEVYKPASQRKWGYYVLPILFRDQLVGRIEPSIDRSRGDLVVGALWWESGVDCRKLVKPMARGLERMARYVRAPRVVLGRLGPPSFRSALERAIRALAN